ncbi:hypothetical protein [Variovorax sp. AFSI2.2]|uniref:hypothetical protein n=1 Tax=Variovorax sp. AFSI2.2 TaxID=3384160 RepID=UPI003EBC3E4F
MQDFNAFTHVALAHFTSSAFLEAIRSEGLKPRNAGIQPILDNLVTSLDDVYLAARADRFYSERATRAFGGVGIAVLVHVPLANLSVDENVFAPNDSSHPVDKKSALHRSLLVGYCKHQGLIAPESIRGIYHMDGRPI